MNTHKGYSIKEICLALKLNRSSYYKWKKRVQSQSELLNVQITEYIKDFYEESNGVLGYRQQYLEYCLKNNVMAAQMRENFDYDGVDLLTLYKAEGKEDIFLRVDAFKDKPWYGDVVLFTRIGTCKPKAEHVPEVCKALKQLGYSVRLKISNGELYVLPAKNKKPKEAEAR